MNELREAAMSGGKNMTSFGVVAIILGFLAMIAPGLTGVSLSIMLGILMLVGGIVRMMWAFGAGSFGKGLMAFALGGLTLLCGIAFLANPLYAANVLTTILAFYFMLDGVVELMAGFQRRPAAGSGWLIFGGITSVILGVMVWSSWPAGAWVIGTLVGIKLFSVGLIMVTGGSAVKSLARG